MNRAAVRLPPLLLTLALFVGTGVGVPVTHHADHHGGEAHYSDGDHGHGHGATLVVRDMRTERPATTASVPALPSVDELPELPARADGRPSRAPAAPTGRSPPAGLLPRAPPSTS